MRDAPHWHLVGHSCELAQPGDFLCLPIEPGFEIAVMNVDGKLAAFDNRCPHRGARIFTERRGNRPPVCAYHGRCATLNVRPMHIAVRHGFVFVVAGETNAFWAMWLLLISEAPLLRLHSTLELVMDCDWQVAVENALDSEHIEHVHPSSLASLELSREHLERSFTGSSIEYFKSAQAERLDRIGRQFEWSASFDYAHQHFYPYAAISSTRGWTWSMQHYLPRADARTTFISRLFVPASAPARLDHLFATVAATSERVFREDAEICARVAPGHEGILGPRDDRIAHFRGTARAAA